MPYIWPLLLLMYIRCSLHCKPGSLYSTTLPVIHETECTTYCQYLGKIIPTSYYRNKGTVEKLVVHPGSCSAWGEKRAWMVDIKVFLLSSCIKNQPLYSGTPPNGHPSKADTHDIMDNSESPDCPPVHFNT